jgi:hypothetical protein
VLTSGGESAAGLGIAEQVANKKAFAEAGKQWVEKNLAELRSR